MVGPSYKGPRFNELDPQRHCPDGAHIGDCPGPEHCAVGQSDDTLHKACADEVCAGGTEVAWASDVAAGCDGVMISDVVVEEAVAEFES
jgi:hypothetical protein